MAISLGYLYRRSLPYLGCSSYSKDFTGNYAVLLILKSRSFRSISKLNLSNSNYRYGLITVDQKDVSLLSNLTVYISPLIVSRLYSLS